MKKKSGSSARSTSKNPAKTASVPAAQRSSSFPVVGIGASAGGLGPFNALLKALPSDTGMAFVFVSHLAPGHDSMLSRLLEKATSMPVAEAAEGAAVQPNHVYVIPPNRGLTIRGGKLRLESRRPDRMVIDGFFRSLAEDRKSKSIGVVLSGIGSDGTVGLRAIKSEGGITFAQDETTAEYRGMPVSAAAGCIDLVLPPEEIGQEIARLARHPYVERHPPDRFPLPAEREAAGLQGILRIVAEATGVDFRRYKPNSVERRIARRVALKRCDSLRAYEALLATDPGEVEALFDDLLIHVTAFFREPQTFEILEKEIFPAILENLKPNEPLRIWVPGCSTGEEVYSLAISATECCSVRKDGRAIQVFGTDISQKHIQIARMGMYPEGSVGEVPPERKQRFFAKTEDGYQVVQATRDRCVFARHDLARDPPFSKLDLISCRNVLIYFGADLQKRAAAAFHYGLKPTGFLVLGKSEAPGSYTNLFELANAKAKVFKRKADSTLPLPDLTALAWQAATRKGSTAFGSPRAPDTRQTSERIILERYSPAGFTVDADLSILHFHGDTGSLLRPAPGAATFNLLKMIRPELATDLRAAIHEARKTNSPVRRKRLRVPRNGGSRTLDLEVIPLREHGGETGNFLALFEEPIPAPRPGKDPAASKAAPADERSAEIAGLREEVALAGDQLRSMAEDHEATLEELRAANEEVLSGNEELQSTNEELETAKEELQSSNEELTTLNEELQNRNDELARMADELGSLLGSVHIPIVMVENDLSIRRFTPAAQKVLNLLPQDAGRPLDDLKTGVNVSNWDELVTEAVAKDRVIEREIQDKTGRWYSLRVQPHKDSGGGADGALLALVDIDRLKRRSSAIVETIREPLLVLDAQSRVVAANPAYYEVFRAEPGQVEGLPVFQAQKSKGRFAELKRLLEEVLPQNKRIHDFEMDEVFPAVGRKHLRINARRLLDEGAETQLILLAIHDVTQRTEAERQLQESEQRFRIIAENAHDICALHDRQGRYLYLSPSAERQLGFAAEELISSRPCDLVHPDDQERFRREGYRLVARTGRPAEATCRFRTKSGEYHWYEIAIQPVLDERGKVTRLRSGARRVTERVMAEMALRESEERYRTLVDMAPSAVIVHAGGEIVYANPAAAAALGADDASGIVGGKALGIVHPGHRKALRQAFESAEEGNASTEAGESRFVRLDGGVIDVVASCRLIAFKGRSDASLLIFQDITGQKRAQRELFASREALARSQQELHRLAGNLLAAQEEERKRVARELHDDLNQKLAMFAKELAEIEERFGKRDGPLGEVLAKLRDGARELSEDASRIARRLHPSALEHLGLIPAVKAFCEDFSRQTRLKVRFWHRNVPDPLGYDIALCLYRVIQEALRNAAKHSRAAAVRVTMMGVKGGIRLRISDSGAGFEMEQARAKGGLGLSSIQERVRLAGGETVVDSRPGAGARIEVRIPLA